jgi:hypothetical protein
VGRARPAAVFQRASAGTWREFGGVQGAGGGGRCGSTVRRGVSAGPAGGSSWVRIDDDQHRFGGSAIPIIAGDLDVYGRVYLGGYGVVYGDRS